MIEYFWVIKKGDKTERVEWDSISESLIAPPSVSMMADDLVADGEIVSLSPVGPKLVAGLDDELSAYGTILYAIELSGFQVIDSSPSPVDPESDLEDSQAS
jgi:hypothetical protein